MRPLEILIPALLAVYILWPLITRRARPVLVNFIPPLALLLNLAHFALEGYRWQMIPLYILTAALDLARVGVYGHSTGGGATIQFCGTDPRCVAGLTQDAFMTPVSQEILDRGVKQPFFFLFSQSWTDDVNSKNNRLFHEFYFHLPAPAPVATILGTRHYDFSDLPLLSPLAPQLGLKGPINGNLVVKILNDYLLAYFDQELKGIPSPLPFDASIDYPDLRWDK